MEADEKAVGHLGDSRWDKRSSLTLSPSSSELVSIRRRLLLHVACKHVKCQVRLHGYNSCATQTMICCLLLVDIFMSPITQSSPPVTRPAIAPPCLPACCLALERFSQFSFLLNFMCKLQMFLRYIRNKNHYINITRFLAQC